MDKISCLGITSDISENGLFLRSSRSFVPETVLHIELTLADNKVSYLKGVVKRTAHMSVSSSKSGMGIELLEKDSAFRTLVRSMNCCHAPVSDKEVMSEKNTSCNTRLVGNSPASAHIPAGQYTKEKRQYRRFDTLGKDIRCGLVFPGKTNILNISMDGVKLTMDKGLYIGRACHLNLQYRNNVANMQGKVIWSCLSSSRKDERGNIIPVYSVGIQFVRSIKEAMKNLGQIIEELALQGDASLARIENIMSSQRTI